MTYQRLQNMASLVLAVSFFAAVYLGRCAKLEILALHVLKAAKKSLAYRISAITPLLMELKIS